MRTPLPKGTLPKGPSPKGLFAKGPSPKGPFAKGSLQRRLLLAALAVTILALLAAGLSIGFILHRFVRGQIDGRLDDRLAALAADLDAGGAPTAARERDGPPFERPRSGWYWQVRTPGAVTRSGSLMGQDLAVPDPRSRGPGRDGSRPADGTGPWGEALILRIRTLPGPAGGPATVLAASAPLSAVRGPVLEAFRTLALALGATGLVLVAGAFLQVRLGLRPLHRLARELAEVRAGRRIRLPAAQPREVRPLVAEMNALLDQNEANLAHARAHVANLAHGLKTPLATLAMAFAERGAAPDAELSRLVEGMNGRVRHHLRRARAAAVGGPVRTRANLADHVADLRMALLRLHAEKGLAITVEVPATLAVACDAQDLDELLGNIVENACQWCRGQVRVVAAASGSAARVVIEDDGPGLPEGTADAMLQRGRRGDEAATAAPAGHGFGLPIAMELAALYGGTLDLGRSDLGGLRVEVALPL